MLWAMVKHGKLSYNAVHMSMQMSLQIDPAGDISFMVAQLPIEIAGEDVVFVPTRYSWTLPPDPLRYLGPATGPGVVSV